MRNCKNKLPRSSSPINSLYMKILEENSEYLGVPRILLMENAGRSVADVVKERVKENSSVVVVAGLGNNGGDGFVAARHLASRYGVTVVLLGRESDIKTAEAKMNWDSLKKQTILVNLYEVPDSTHLEACEGVIKGADAVIDAIFGTGLRGEVRGRYRLAIELMNSSKGVKIAVDTPSGLNPDTGEVHGIAVKADVTVTFHAVKRGFLNPNAKPYLGELVVAPIGIPPEAEIVCGPGDVKVAVKRRAAWSKKGDHGRVLVVGGSEDYTGAPALTALAALRAGADIAVVAAPEDIANVLRCFSPNLIIKPLGEKRLSLNDVNELVDYAAKFDVVAIGPGLGLHEETRKAVTDFLRKVDKPVVVDADALKALPEDPTCLKGKKAVLTPHAGELKLLVGKTVSENIEERVEAAMYAAKVYGVTVLLKGHVDVVANSSKYKINRTGTPAMTVGGTGDILTGVTATLLAHCGDPFLAASAASHVNGVAGEIATEKKGYHIVATDVLEAIPEAFTRTGAI